MNMGHLMTLSQAMRRRAHDIASARLLSPQAIPRDRWAWPRLSVPAGQARAEPSFLAIAAGWQWNRGPPNACRGTWRCQWSAALSLGHFSCLEHLSQSILHFLRGFLHLPAEGHSQLSRQKVLATPQ